MVRFPLLPLPLPLPLPPPPQPASVSTVSMSATPRYFAKFENVRDWVTESLHLGAKTIRGGHAPAGQQLFQPSRIWSSRRTTRGIARMNGAPVAPKDATVARVMRPTPAHRPPERWMGRWRFVR